MAYYYIKNESTRNNNDKLDQMKLPTTQTAGYND